MAPNNGIEVRRKMSPLQAGKMFMENIHLQDKIDELESDLKKYKEFHESVTCFFAEGVEFMNKIELYDAFKKEWEKII